MSTSTSLPASSKPQPRPSPSPSPSPSSSSRPRAAISELSHPGLKAELFSKRKKYGIVKAEERPIVPIKKQVRFGLPSERAMSVDLDADDDEEVAGGVSSASGSAGIAGARGGGGAGEREESVVPMEYVREGKERRPEAHDDTTQLNSELAETATFTRRRLRSMAPAPSVEPEDARVKIKKEVNDGANLLEAVMEEDEDAEKDGASAATSPMPGRAEGAKWWKMNESSEMERKGEVKKGSGKLAERMGLLVCVKEEQLSDEEVLPSPPPPSPTHSMSGTKRPSPATESPGASSPSPPDSFIVSPPLTQPLANSALNQPPSTTSTGDLDDLPDYEESDEEMSSAPPVLSSSPSGRTLSDAELVETWSECVGVPSYGRGRDYVGSGDEWFRDPKVQLLDSEVMPHDYNIYTLQSDVDFLVTTLHIPLPPAFTFTASSSLPSLFLSPAGYRVLLFRPSLPNKLNIHSLTFPRSTFSPSSESWESALVGLDARGVMLRDVVEVYERFFRPRDAIVLRQEGGGGSVEVLTLGQELERVHAGNSIYWLQLVSLAIIKKASLRLATHSLFFAIQKARRERTELSAEQRKMCDELLGKIGERLGVDS
ncbi:hypothetical protein MNV49_003226 [Pseudohyphozyma bogoriensis]|nr:hypothetical protein MNV49_003226 [Pseudohyphozyma bogoriensis]